MSVRATDLHACRSCGADVVFVRSGRSGKPMILNAFPTKGVVINNDLGYPTVVDDPAASAYVVNVYTDHHATCPNAADWKGKTRASPP